jgi:hypothetical protein
MFREVGTANGQPLPGKWTGVNAGAKGPLFGNRWINVIESDTADWFKVAIGHVGPNCTKEIHFAEQSYEEQIFCVPPEPVGNGTAALLSEEWNIFSSDPTTNGGLKKKLSKNHRIVWRTHLIAHCKTTNPDKNLIRITFSFIHIVSGMVKVTATTTTTPMTRQNGFFRTKNCGNAPTPQDHQNSSRST